MGTSVGAAIDYVVAQVASPCQLVDPTAMIIDSWPVNAQVTNSMVWIGRTSADDATTADGTQQSVALGMNSSDEDYSIPCFIQCARPGPAQKPSRDAAVALFDAVNGVIAHDRTLAGVLKNRNGALVDNVRIIQTRNTTDTGHAGSMRVTTITFDIHCRNQYIA
jgi:hypothetical protein